MRKSKIRVLFAASIFMGPGFANMLGQSPPSAPSAPSPQYVAISGTESTVSAPQDGAIGAGSQIIRVGDDFTVPIKGLGTCPADVDKVVLQFDDIDSGLAPIGCAAGGTGFKFELNPARSKDPSGPVWKAILGDVGSLRHSHWIRPIQARVQAFNAAGSAIASEPVALSVRVVSSGFILVAAALMLATAVGGLILFGRYSGMLRDANSNVTKTRRPYSLSRVQMAWWFGIVFASCAALWVITGAWPIVGSTALTLLAVSGGAGVVAIGIDSGSDKVVPPSQGFWLDILTDVQGITLARFQMLIWNLALGLYFLGRVFSDTILPEFDSTTLGLLGLSASAYVGLKVPEKHS